MATKQKIQNLKKETQEILKLRKATKAGMMDCKNAIKEVKRDLDRDFDFDLDFEKAIEYLRKKGKKIANKRANRTTSQGAVFTKVNDTNNVGVILVLRCETDYVAKNNTFEALGNNLVTAALDHQPTTIEELLKLQQNNITLQEKITETIGILGENLSIAQYHLLTSPIVASYIHTGSTRGALVAFNHPTTITPKVLQASRDIAIQVVAENPLAIDEKTLEPTILEKEKKIFIEELKEQGKNPAIIEKITQGKINKFIKEKTLLAQCYVKDRTQTVAQYLEEKAPNLTISSFKRIAIVL